MIRLYDTERNSYADVLATFKPKYHVDYLIKYDWDATLVDRTYTKRQLRKTFVTHNLKPRQKYYNLHFIYKDEIGKRYKIVGRYE